MKLPLRGEDYWILVFIISASLLLISEGAESNKPSRKDSRLYDDAGKQID